MKKIHNKKHLYFLILIVGLIFLSIPINVNADNNINFTFNRDILVDTSSTSFDSDFNLRPISAYLGHYNATYGFLDDIDYSNPSGWSISEPTGSINVFPLIDGHRKIVEINDTGNQLPTMTNSLGLRDFGTIDYWMYTTDTTESNIFQLYKTNQGTGVLIYIFQDGFYSYDGVTFQQIPGTPIALDNTWYHFRIDFDADGGYLGLGADEYRIYINSTNFGVYSTRFAQADFSDVRFQASTAESGYKVYIDAVGYSWQNYNINDNILPILESSENILEVDKDEFALVDTNTFYTLGVNNPDGYTPTETAGGQVNIVTGLDAVNDRELDITVTGGGDLAGITKDNLALTGSEFYTTEYKFSIRDVTGANGEFNARMYSSDNTEMLGFKADIVNASYFNIDIWSGGFFTVIEGIALQSIIDIIVVLNYEIDIGIFNISINGVFNNTFLKSLFSLGKSGLKKVEVLLTSAFAMEVFLDSVGIYFQGNSNAKGLGFATIDLGIAEWNSEHNNLFTTQTNGNVSIGTVEGSYTISESFNEINDFFQFTNISDFKNVYESVITEVSNPTFVLTVNGTQFSVNTFLIEGVILNENGNEYRLDFTFGNVDISESYFFVNNQNELRFINQVDDELTEFIQARFNINDVSSNNLAVSYRSIKSGNSIGNLRINFTTTSNILEIPIVEQTRRVVLTQNRTIRDIVILISDNDLLTSGITTGFISNIRFIDSQVVDTSILTISIIDMMIPLIMILIPSLAISQRYGKDFIVPMFLLMSIVLTVSFIIPVWLFFIIALTNSLFIYLRKGKLE